MPSVFCKNKKHTNLDMIILFKNVLSNITFYVKNKKNHSLVNNVSIFDKSLWIGSVSIHINGMIDKIWEEKMFSKFDDHKKN